MSDDVEIIPVDTRVRTAQVSFPLNRDEMELLRKVLLEKTSWVRDSPLAASLAFRLETHLRNY